MLITDEMISKATGQTTTSQLTRLIPQLWAAVLEKNLRRRDVFMDSVVQNTDLLVPGAGDKVYVPILPDLAALGTLTEGTDITLTQLNAATSVELTPTEVGMAVEVTRKALDRMKYNGVEEVLDRLSYAMSLYIQGAIAGLYNATVPKTGGGGASISALYPNGHDTTNIVATDTFSDKHILDAVASMEEGDNVPFDDGYYRLYITPRQFSSLMQDDEVRNDLRYGAPQRLFTNEKGALHGCRIITTNYIKIANEGAGSAVPVANALLVSPRWAAIAWKRKVAPIIDPTLYDMGRRRRFGILADLDIELLHAERALVLKSAQ